MSGEKELTKLLQTLEGHVHDDVFVFVTCHKDDVPDDGDVQMQFQEADGVTLILSKQKAQDHGFSWEFACRMITLKIHSSLEAVGFIAHIASELAKADMGVNPVSGFFHDHLFVPVDRVDDAMAILAQIRQMACEKAKAAL